jgi:hypothetical protein
VVSATLEPPQRLGVTHWSSRLLATQLGISHMWVGKIWRRSGLQVAIAAVGLQSSSDSTIGAT